MAKHYLDYFWENGMPNGMYPVDNQQDENTYTIINVCLKSIGIEGAAEIPK